MTERGVCVGKFGLTPVNLDPDMCHTLQTSLSVILPRKQATAKLHFREKTEKSGELHMYRFLLIQFIVI